jgi:protein AbiQ
MNRNSYGLKTIKVGKQWNGIDYSKALVVNDDDLTSEAFKLRDENEYKKLQSSKAKIKKDFSEYVQEYKYAIVNKITLPYKFKFTTLQYFHNELGI